MKSIERFPEELVVIVLEYLDDGVGILNMGQVKRQFYGPSTDDKVWKRHCENVYNVIQLDHDERAVNNYIDEYRKQMTYNGKTRKLIDLGCSGVGNVFYEGVIKIGLLGPRARLELKKALKIKEREPLVVECLNVITHLRSLRLILKYDDPLSILRALEGFYNTSITENNVADNCRMLVKQFCELVGKSQIDFNRSNVDALSQFLTNQGILQSRSVNATNHIGELEIKCCGLGARYFLSGIFSQHSQKCCNIVIRAFIYCIIVEELFRDEPLTASVVLSTEREVDHVLVKLDHGQSTVLVIDPARDGSIIQHRGKFLKPLTTQNVLDKVVTPGIGLIGDSIFTPHSAVSRRSLGLRVTKNILEKGSLRELQLPLQFTEEAPWELELIDKTFPSLHLNKELLNSVKIHNK